jgi:hypothetical protein
MQNTRESRILHLALRMPLSISRFKPCSKRALTCCNTIIKKCANIEIYRLKIDLTFAITGLGNRAGVASTTRIMYEYCKTQQFGDISQDRRAVAKNSGVKAVLHITTS